MVNTNYTMSGQVVYFVSRIGIEKCSIISFGSENNGGYIKVQHNGTVDYNGKEICPTYGESYVKESDLFLTLEEAIHSVKKSEEERINRYKNSIKTLKDLIEFPIFVSFDDGDGCQDGLVVKAYTERAQELLGIELSV